MTQTPQPTPRTTLRALTSTELRDAARANERHMHARNLLDFFGALETLSGTRISSICVTFSSELDADKNEYQELSTCTVTAGTLTLTVSICGTDWTGNALQEHDEALAEQLSEAFDDLTVSDLEEHLMAFGTSEDFTITGDTLHSLAEQAPSAVYAETASVTSSETAPPHPADAVLAYAPNGLPITHALMYVPGLVGVTVVQENGRHRISPDPDSQETELNWDGQLHVSDAHMNVTPDQGGWYVDARGAVWPEASLTFRTAPVRQD